MTAPEHDSIGTVLPCAVVTGASRGIGRQLARLLLSTGVSVLITGRNPNRLEATAEELRRSLSPELSPHIIFVTGDVSNPEHCRNVVETARKECGGIDVLFNNAGLSMRGSVEELTDTTIRTLTNTNFRGAVNMTVAALPSLLERRGSVVFVSTLAALVGFPGVSIYSATKMGLTAFAQSLRAETRKRGLHVGVVYLGFTENDAAKTILDAAGNPFQHERKAGLTQEQAARKIYRLWIRRRRYDYTVPTGYLLAFTSRFLPRFTARLLASSGGTIHRVGRRQ